jgi:hypothetical protein
MPIPRIILGISLTAVVGAAAGCGGTSSPSPGATSVSPQATARPIANTAGTGAQPVRGSSAHAQYVGFARAVNLRAGDLPGFVGKPKKHRHRNLHNKAFEADSQYRRCFSIGKQTKTVFKASSDEFSDVGRLSYASASSQVEIAPTIATAQRELATIRKALGDPASARCLARIFDRLGAQSQPIRTAKGTVRITVGGLRLAPLQVGSATAGTDGGLGLSLGMNVTYTVSARGRTATLPTPLHLEVLAFAVGRGEVTLTVITLGQPFPPEREARLFSLLVSRAVAARHEYRAIGN